MRMRDMAFAAALAYMLVGAGALPGSVVHASDDVAPLVVDNHIPEPSTLALMAAGGIGVAARFVRRRRDQKGSARHED